MTANNRSIVDKALIGNQAMNQGFRPVTVAIIPMTKPLNG